MRLLEGNVVKKQILKELSIQCSDLIQQHGISPGLAVILVGDNPASQAYVRMKRKACDSVGMVSFEHSLPDTITKEELMDCINQLNKDNRVHGILLQLPLPAHLDSDTMLHLKVIMGRHSSFDTGVQAETHSLLQTNEQRAFQVTP